jgi:hypothetical protein
MFKAFDDSNTVSIAGKPQIAQTIKGRQNTLSTTV